MQTGDSFEHFLDIIKQLRAPGGCPWDINQTPISLRSTFIEETYEAIDAINDDDVPHIREELGDVFLNVAMIAYMYEQEGDFSVADVLDEVSEKLIRRHPHVFPQSEAQYLLDETAKTSEEVLNQWDKIKEELEGKKGDKTILDEVPMSFPPLLRAYKMQKKASKKGFDWENPDGARAKVFEEILELEVETKLNPETKEKIEDEAGDLLFACVNWIRHLGIDPSVALAKSNEKFKSRFTIVEQEAKKQGINMKQENLAKLDELWNLAKTKVITN